MPDDTHGWLGATLASILLACGADPAGPDEAKPKPVTPEPPRVPEAEPAERSTAEDGAETVVPDVSAIEGLRHAQVTVTGTSVRAEVFEVDLRRLRLVGLDARTPERSVAAVDDLREEANAHLAVNGTFFDERERPLGLLVDSGKTLSPLRQADWGVFTVDRDGTARLVHTKDFHDDAAIDFAVQCGPRVVIDGTPPRLKPQLARRTGLCIEDPRTVAVFVVDELVDASALATWLAAAPDTGGLGCTEAVLLDGGPSTQLDVRGGPKHPTIRGGWPVPNGIAVTDRPKPDP